MNCDKVTNLLRLIGVASLDARAKLDNGDSTGVERALREIDKVIATVRKELKE